MRVAVVAANIQAKAIVSGIQKNAGTGGVDVVVIDPGPMARQVVAANKAGVDLVVSIQNESRVKGKEEPAAVDIWEQRAFAAGSVQSAGILFDTLAASLEGVPVKGGRGYPGNRNGDFALNRDTDAPAVYIIYRGGEADKFSTVCAEGIKKCAQAPFMFAKAPKSRREQAVQPEKGKAAKEAKEALGGAK